MRDPERDPPRSLAERIGTTVASGSLASDAFDIGAERARERIGALGAATLTPSPAPTKIDLAAKWDDKRRLAALLWRMKFGEHPDPSINVVSASGREAAVLFAWYLRRHPMFKNYRGAGSPLLFRMAARVIVEWCHDRCAHCGGTKLAGIDPNAAARNVLRRKRCTKCINHPGKAGIDHVARANAIELPGKIYHRFFERRFAWAHDVLKRTVRSMKAPVARQLDRRGLAMIEEED